MLRRLLAALVVLAAALGGRLVTALGRTRHWVTPAAYAVAATLLGLQGWMWLASRPNGWIW